MTSLQKISLKQIKNSRGRFWTTVMGAALSTAMIFAVLIGSSSGMDALRRYVIGQNGEWHWSVDRLPIQALSQLSEDSFSAKCGSYGGKLSVTTQQGIGLDIYGVTGDFLDMMQTEIVSGKLPQASNELLIDNKFATEHLLTVGEQIYLTDEDGITRNMTITGIYSHSVLNLQLATDENDMIAFYGIDENNPMGENIYRYFSAANQLDATYYTHTGILAQLILADNPQSVSFYQSSLITISGALGPDGTNRTLFFINLLRGALLLIISAACCMMIVNSFYISIAERRRTLGMIASIGATNRQISMCLLYEALYVAFIGIPLGVLLGYIGLGFAFRMLTPLMSNIKQTLGMDLSLYLVVRPQWIMISTVMCLAVLLFSAWLPARNFSKGSIIQAISGDDEIQVSKKITRIGDFFGKLFGAETMLGIKSAKRNARRYYATVGALAVCISLFIASAGLAQYIPKVNEANNQTQKYPISVDYAVSEVNILDTQSYQALIYPKTPVQQIAIEESILLDMANIPASKYTSENIQLSTALNDYVENDSYTALVEFKVVSDEEYLKLLGKNNAPTGTVSCVLANRYFYRSQNVKQTMYQTQDIVQVKMKDMPVNLYISAVDNSKYVEQRIDNASRLIFIVSCSSVNELMESWKQLNQSDFPRNVHISYKTDSPKELKEELKSLAFNETLAEGTTDYLLVSDNSKEMFLTQAMNIILKIILYGFSALIFLICICHVITTISTSLVLQIREFAMLKSLGITENGLRKMILVQSIVYGVEALIYGLSIGFILLWIEYSILRKLAGFIFSIPWWSILISIIVISITVITIALYFLKTIKNEPICDVL